MRHDLHIGKSLLHLYRFPPQDEKCFGPLGQESCEFMNQNVLNLVGLFDLDADSYAIDAGLNENSLIFVASHSQGVENDLGGGFGFNLGHIVSFGRLRGKIGQRESSGQ